MFLVYELVERIRAEARELFADVVEEYASPSTILERLAEWHAQSPRLYRDAYVSEYLRELLAPLLRLALLEWNPLVPHQSASSASASAATGGFLATSAAAPMPSPLREPTEQLSNRVVERERDQSRGLPAETLFGDAAPFWFVAFLRFCRQIIERERGQESPIDNADAKQDGGEGEQQRAADSKPAPPSKLPEETLVADIVERIVLPKLQGAGLYL